MTVLHHVQVSCPRGTEGATRAFYGDLLGLAEVSKPPELAKRGGVWFRGTGYELHVGVEEDFAPARKAHPAFLVPDVDALASRLAAAGADVTWNSDFPGYRRFHTHDPHGNRVEILAVDARDSAAGDAGQASGQAGISGGSAGISGGSAEAHRRSRRPPRMGRYGEGWIMS